MIFLLVILMFGIDSNMPTPQQAKPLSSCCVATFYQSSSSSLSSSSSPLFSSWSSYKPSSHRLVVKWQKTYVYPSLKSRREKGQLGKFLGNLVLLSTSLGRPLWQSLKLGRRDTRGSQDWPQRVNNIIIIISSIIIVIIVIAIVIMAVAGELPGSISQDSFWVRR